MMPPDQSIRLVKKYGIKVPEYRFVKSCKEALDFSGKIGYPVVMKLSSPDVTHKTEAGGVFTGVFRSGVKPCFQKIKKIKGCETVLVQKQVRGLETIAGGIRDRQFGPCISFGTGGIFVEILKDVKFRVCPVSKKEALDMIKETRIYRVLKGYRGRKYNINELVETLAKVSRLMMRENVKELDINPLICSRDCVWAVDVRVS